MMMAHQGVTMMPHVPDKHCLTWALERRPAS